MKQYGFFVDSTKCTGCKTCQVSCKDEKIWTLGQNCGGYMNTGRQLDPTGQYLGAKCLQLLPVHCL